MAEKLDWLRGHDLGLTYEEAMHGVQTSLGFGFFNRSMEPKHARTGIDMTKADILGIVCLLMDKGVITEEEYLEYIRLSANTEVAHREVQAKHTTGKDISFR